MERNIGKKIGKRKNERSKYLKGNREIIVFLLPKRILYVQAVKYVLDYYYYYFIEIHGIYGIYCILAHVKDLKITSKAVYCLLFPNPVHYTHITISDRKYEITKHPFQASFQSTSNSFLSQYN